MILGLPRLLIDFFDFFLDLLQLLRTQYTSMGHLYQLEDVDDIVDRFTENQELKLSCNHENTPVLSAISLVDTYDLQFQPTLPHDRSFPCDVRVPVDCASSRDEKPQVDGIPLEIGSSLKSDTLVEFPDSKDVSVTIHQLTHESASAEASRMIQPFTDPPKLSEPVNPWTLPKDGPCVEDNAIPAPTAFRISRDFLGIPIEAVINAFREKLDAKISPDFASATDVKEKLVEMWWPVFCPVDWTGINGISPIELETKEGMPDVIRAPIRPVHPSKFSAFKKEFARMQKYFYVDSDSPIASPMVIADKATDPYLRLCGGYVTVNKYLICPRLYLPSVKSQLDKAREFKYFIDLDLSNAYHQIPLSEKSSKLLSVQTVLGLYRPMFLPEGISPATAILQRTMTDIFKDCEQWTIVLHDNLLVLAKDHHDALEKLEIVMQRCLDRNIKLKVDKCSFGLTEIKFFGYRVSSNSYTISDDKKEALANIPFPDTLHSMQSFLGTALFFSPFVLDYSRLAAPFYDTTRKDQPWPPVDLDGSLHKRFEEFKQSLIHCFEIYYPDFELEWVLRTDASTLGVGGCLFQLVPQADGSVIMQPIAMIAMKFSLTAAAWSTLEQELFAVVYTVKELQHYLAYKSFIVECDHRNVLFLEKANVPKLIRWRLFLQSFSFLIRHIPGKDNVVADYLSRHFAVKSKDNQQGTVAHISALAALPSEEEMFSAVHGGRNGHFGVARTYAALNKLFPGHEITIRRLRQLLDLCVTCQKISVGRSRVKYAETYRHLHVPSLHAAIGVDMLTITPADIHGNSVAIVIVVLFSKLVFVYPCRDYTAKTLAMALFKFYSQYGVFEQIRSDPGSNLTSEAIALLHSWLGMQQVFSLVDVHTSNGVERTNGRILEHLRKLVIDESVQQSWSDDSVLPLVVYFINSSYNSQIGGIPFEMHFGSDAKHFHKLSPSDDPAVLSNEYLQLLNKNMRSLHAASTSYQKALVSSKEHHDTELPRIHRGEHVLRDNAHRKNKLQPVWLGPYIVLDVYKNDVTIEHIAEKSVVIVHVSTLKPFRGPASSHAFQASLADNQQFEVIRIHSYLGDPWARTTLRFKVEYADGEILWVGYKRDLFETEAYKLFVGSIPQLLPLVRETNNEALNEKHRINKTPIIKVSAGEKVFVNLRVFGELWFNQRPLPDLYVREYFVEGVFTTFDTKKRNVKIFIKVSGDEFTWDHYSVLCFGQQHKLAENDILVDTKIASAYKLFA